MFYILIIAAMALATFGYFSYCKWNFSTASKSNKAYSTNVIIKNKKRVENNIAPQALNNESSRDSFIKKFKKLPFIGYDEYKKEEVDHLCDAIDWGVMGSLKYEDIYFEQLIYAILCGIIIIILSLINPVFLLLIIPAYFIYRMPINRLESVAYGDMDKIMYEFPDFYDMVYVQYKDDNNVLLSDVVENYSAMAGPAFRKLLKRFSLDLSGGEDRALQLLDARYQGNPVIHKFCNVLRQKLKGDSSAATMMYHFREELQADVKDWEMDDLKQRKEIVDKVVYIMIAIVLGISMIVYFYNFWVMSV